MQNIREKETNVTLSSGDGYEEIEFATQEEIIKELKRVRRAIWELKRNHSRSISYKESDKIFGELQKLKKENKENKSKETSYFKYAKAFNITRIILSAFSLIMVLISFVAITRWDDYYTGCEYLNMTIPAILIPFLLISFGIVTLIFVKKKDYHRIEVLNIISSLIGLVIFFIILVGYGTFIFDFDGLIILIIMGVTTPLSVAIVISTVKAHNAYLNKRKK